MAMPAMMLAEVPATVAQKTTPLIQGLIFDALGVEQPGAFAILIYDGIEGTTYYGTNSVSGVILIKTKDGQS